MAKRESLVEKNTVKAAKAAGWWERKFEILTDDPDRLFIRDSRVVFMEFKRPNEPARPGQVRRIKELKALGVEVYLVDNEAFGKAILQC